MWPFNKKPQTRRVEVRRIASASGLSMWARFCAGGGLATVPIAILFYLCVLAMDLWTVDPFLNYLNQYVPAGIYARVPFRVRSRELEIAAENMVRNTTPATFRMNEALVEEIAATLQQLPDRLKPTASTQPAGAAASQPASQPASRPAVEIDAVTRDMFDLHDANDFRAWHKVSSPAIRAKYNLALDRLRDRLALVYSIDPREFIAPNVRRPGVAEFWAVQGKTRQKLKMDELIRTSDIGEIVPRMSADFDKTIRRSIEQYLLKTLRARPLYAYDDDVTGSEIQAGIAEIQAHPPMKEFHPGDILVHASRRVDPNGRDVVEGLLASELDLLRSEHREYDQRELLNSPQRLWLHVLGRAAILLLVSALLSMYIASYKPDIARNPWRAAVLAGLLLAMLLMVRIWVFSLGWNPYTVTLPVLMAAIIAAIAYDQRFAMAIGACLSFFVIYQMRAEFSMLLVLMAGFTAAIFSLKEIRTRTKLIAVSALAAAAIFCAVWASGLAADIPPRFVFRDSLWASAFALLVGFLVWGILPAVEKLFGVATSITLLEWSDASKPLLKRLAMEAPGTYNHSLQLASICESAAESIGARGLLVRVGAYYHDVGKANKPEYFTENLFGMTSPHAKLSPAMSLLIIIGHVKDGLEMAHEYGLPTVLHEFIATHHGTTLVQVFYNQAAEHARANQQREPDEIEFRYQGPKPHSKESAILLLADACESSVRAMADPTPGRIENQVHTMVSRRLMDGQLDECGLTLAEVHLIESSLVKSLCSIYHSRIAYPTPAGQKPSAAELRPKKPAGENA